MTALHHGWLTSLAADIARLAAAINPATATADQLTLLADATDARWAGADALTDGTCTDDHIVAVWVAATTLADALAATILPARH